MNRLHTLTFLLIAVVASAALAKSPIDEEGRLLNFSRDVAPIFVRACLDCHGPTDAKNDFRVDDRDSLLSYISPTDLEGSSLWSDYLVTEDEDMLMPPASKGGPLPPAELAILRTWIAEGAHWPADAVISASDGPLPELVVVPISTTFGGRLWAFQGYFHPAVVHFPIALLSVGALFVVLGWVRKDNENLVAYYLLILGAISAIAAAAMGWSFAIERGFGDWDRTDNPTLTRHRWFGVGVAVLTTILAVIAIISQQRGNKSLRKIWQAGLLVSAMLTGLVGHQGGELSYGERLYHDAFDRLLGREPGAKSSGNTESETETKAEKPAVPEATVASS